MKRYSASRQAKQDILEIWEWIATDSRELADRVVADFYQAFENIAQMPGIGHERSDLTSRKLLFFPVHSYLVVYDTTRRPLRIVAVLRAARDVKSTLRKRQPDR